ncbi:hypothetical protein INR49_022321 [Caranx melampygus]|nr:hypothetical protein INR49_022321 [Caranx melampygus]
MKSEVRDVKRHVCFTDSPSCQRHVSVSETTGSTFIFISSILLSSLPPPLYLLTCLFPSSDFPINSSYDTQTTEEQQRNSREVRFSSGFRMVVAEAQTRIKPDPVKQCVCVCVCVGVCLCVCVCSESHLITT